jgi:prophage tail gpP-like protein
MANSHRITITVRGDIHNQGGIYDAWTGYHVESSMITPADAFELRRAFDADAWNLLRRDAQVRLQVDDTTILDGYIDKRVRSAKAGTMVISGRDRVGRLVDESAPEINYSSMTVLSAIQKLAAPWFTKVTLSDARNRALRRGKGRRVASSTEQPVAINIRVPRQGTVHPGMSRWQVIHEIASRAGLIAYSSADGTELFVGKPNHNQAAQYLFVHAKLGAQSGFVGNIKDLTITEDDGERYSLIMCAGTGGQGDTNYGKNVADHRGVVFDNPDNRLDGTGDDFLWPKRLFMPEKSFASHGDAQRVAANEQTRRDYKRHLVSIEAPFHGQFLGPGPPVLFAPNTVARVIDEEQDPIMDDTYLVVSCAYSGSREQGETTTLHLVPTDTEIIL